MNFSAHESFDLAEWRQLRTRLRLLAIMRDLLRDMAPWEPR